MLTLTGVIKKLNIGVGTWTLKADGQIYELKKLPLEFKHEGLEAEITGKVLDGVMSMAMVGPIFEVQSIEVAQ